MRPCYGEQEMHVLAHEIGKHGLMYISLIFDETHDDELKADVYKANVGYFGNQERQ